MQTTQQQQEVSHMNSAAATTSLFSFMKAPVSAGKQACAERSRSISRRARPPEKWSLHVDLPLVRESMRDLNGGPVRARTPQDIVALCDDIRHSAQEAFIVVDLNAKNNVIDKRLVSLGLLDASLVHPREVFRGAIVNNAAAVVVCHNHPSGDPTPSAEDIRITRQLVDAGKVLSIRVLDHVVIGRPDNGTPGFLSLREAGLVAFSS
jgi:DNA repair protein RadC